MNPMQLGLAIALASVATLVGVVALAGFVWAYLDMRSRQKAVIETMRALTANLGNLGRAPGYIEGLVKVCEDQVKTVASLTESVENFRKALFGAEHRDTEKQAFTEYREDDAQRAWEEQQLVEQGFNPEQAREKVRDIASGQGRMTFRLRE